MTYLEPPRLSFSGRFQADVSTVNNDVRHFDNATFEPRFQGPMETTSAGTAANGWWNPDGTGTFRLIDVLIRSAAGGSGPLPGDPAIGLVVAAQADQAPAKLVDLDPQFQMGSAIWGLTIILTDGGRQFLSGRFRAAPFRDIFFGRVSGRGGSTNASAKFTSVLEDVVFTEHAGASPLLSALRAIAEANENRLSVNLMTYGYDTGAISPETFTLGRVVGAIGPWRATEPMSFVCGRRFAPANPANPFATVDGIGYFDAVVREREIFLDLGNAMPLADPSGTMKDLGPVSLAVLNAADEHIDDEEGVRVKAGIVDGAEVTPVDYVAIGSIDYRRPDWLLESAGLTTLALSTDAAQATRSRPLALLTLDSETGRGRVLIRESSGGFFLRADEWQQRIDTVHQGVVSTSVTLHARRYGAPLADFEITCALMPPEEDEGGGSPDWVREPSAPIPRIGDPGDAIRFLPMVRTDASGVATLAVEVADPQNPRGYLDGQIYKIGYNFPIGGLSPLPLFDQLVLHVRDAFASLTRPSWEDHIAPVLAQYGNLYPIMSKGLFSFAERAVVEARAAILRFALSRPLDDPNHMPVTRDLSTAKRAAIITWLDSVMAASEALAPAAAAAAITTTASTLPPAPLGSVRTLSPQAAAYLERLLTQENRGRTNALRSFLQTHRPAPD